MLIPFLVVALGVLRDEHGSLLAKDAAKIVFSSMFSSVIMLLIGGFSMAAALSKHTVARRLATKMLSMAGTSPKAVLLATMFVSTFLSMWISNVAAPVLCFSLLQVIHF